MSLNDWLKNGWVQRHETSPREIADLFGVADRDLANSAVAGLSPDWKLNIAYNAALQVATAALAASGFRASREQHHYRVIHSLELTIQAQPDLIRRFDAFRKKRNVDFYERAGAVSEGEAGEMQQLARKLRQDVMDWLRANHRHLLPKS